MAFDKELYWKNREAQKRGQGDKSKPKVIRDENSKAEIGFDNQGNMIAKTRSYRRRKIKLPGSSMFTKKQLTQTERKKARKLGRH